MDAINGFFGDYRFLSNFYKLDHHVPDLDHGDIFYPTVEHAYQAMKTTDVESRRLIAKCATAKSAKHCGYKVVLRKEWEEDSFKVDIMRSLLTLKFECPILRAKLLDTYPMVLREVNTWNDKFWGCDRNFIGKNWLGILLMEIREAIVKDERVGL